MASGFGPHQAIVLASHNQGKLGELEQLLEPYGIACRGIAEWTQIEPTETGNTFQENALIKARAAHLLTGLSCLADDSGLEVFGLEDQPGIHSARWAAPGGDFTQAMARIRLELINRHGTFNGAPQDARFVCVLAFVDHTGEETIIEGKCCGRIVEYPRGQLGFGYDPIFVPHGDTRTFGEMAPHQKAMYSHRARAFAKLEKHLARHDFAKGSSTKSA